MLTSLSPPDASYKLSSSYLNVSVTCSLYPHETLLEPRSEPISSRNALCCLFCDFQTLQMYIQIVSSCQDFCHTGTNRPWRHNLVTPTFPACICPALYSFLVDQHGSRLSLFLAIRDGCLVDCMRRTNCVRLNGAILYPVSQPHLANVLFNCHKSVVI